MLNIYGDIQSGNCYKVALTCSLLAIKHNWLNMDILKGDTKSENFLHKNPTGKIPFIELENDMTLAESNAIVNFLAYDSDLLPKNAYEFAKVQQWQFFEQYSHEPYIAVARFISKYLGLPDNRKEEYLSKQTSGYKALEIMEHQLAQTSYLVGDKFTVADISLFAYTHVAEEGGFDLTKYKAINAWLDRIKQKPNFIAMN